MIDIQEYIQIGDFNSKEQGFYVQSRDAPTPAEKQVTENIPYANGLLDFSNITGERIFEQRTITYKLIMVNTPYSERKAIENRCKRLLMSPFDARLYDTHDKGYYWLGKCSSVKVDDDSDYNALALNVEFSLYPFAIKNRSDDSTWDDWDSFDFDNDFAQPFNYVVDKKLEINLMNVGENSVAPEVVTTGDIIITKNGRDYSFNANKTKDFLFNLDRGANDLIIKGNATVRFIIQSEVML